MNLTVPERCEIVGAKRADEEEEEPSDVDTPTSLCSPRVLQDLSAVCRAEQGLLARLPSVPTPRSEKGANTGSDASPNGLDMWVIMYY
jgi:hypothetical protein